MIMSPTLWQICRLQLVATLRIKDTKIPLLDMFATSRAVLEGKARHLRDHGKGQRPNKTSSIDFDEEEKLWQCEQLGSKTPMSLINRRSYSESGFGWYRVSDFCRCN